MSLSGNSENSNTENGGDNDNNKYFHFCSSGNAGYYFRSFAHTLAGFWDIHYFGQPHRPSFSSFESPLSTKKIKV